ncbi:hypothetical protein C2S53_016126 [Perilla frutescens var. hirtella]|uniref:DC1 domain-containing protein n=1 Tax=Perilla frutescens var. hirtella TaxID=608512 RepID=A0AAD4J5L3_PERFH|nr:hypothetical protein C2S53_016126 [Perilla frutescens var. hirtella]
MPNRITHPFHKKHAFTLLPEPAYDGGVFNCDACRESGDGFSYHCKPCGIDLHILCAAAPLSLSTGYHAHKLELAFESPYDTKNFVCDVCSGHGSDHWLYRCNACGFDAHLKCARAAPPPLRQEQEATSSRSVPQPRPYFVAAPPHPVMSSAAVGVPTMPAFGVNGQNDLALQAIVQMIQNNNAMVQAMMAGGGFGGDRGSQQMLQLISALNRSGQLGGGLDIFGGGGLDSLQSLFGGGGGLDLLGGLGGLF